MMPNFLGNKKEENDEVKIEEPKKEIKSSKNVIDNETANFEFERFCESWRIDYELEDANQEEKNDFNVLKKRLVKTIKEGRLYLNEDRTLTYILSDFNIDTIKGKKLIIKRPLGDSYMSMDHYKDQQNMHKMYSIIANMVGHSTQYLSRLDGADLDDLTGIFTLFRVG